MKKPLLPREVRVTNLDAFRIWKETEDLDIRTWLLPRLLGEEEHTAEEKERLDAGSALHQALELMANEERELATVKVGEYRFDFNCSCEVVLPTIRESEFVEYYGDVMVVGHVDGIIGNMVVDYKTCARFDWDRYMESYQWRYYLDMSGCNQFLYQIFVIEPFGPEHCYSVKDTHRIKQFRYPGLHTDCEALVREYREIVLEHEALMAS